MSYFKACHIDMTQLILKRYTYNMPIIYDDMTDTQLNNEFFEALKNMPVKSHAL